MATAVERVIPVNREDPVRMVDVTDKVQSYREAEARGRIVLQADTVTAMREGRTKKGDVLTVAEIAGLQAAKRTAELIPLCHQIPLTSVQLAFEFGDKYVEARCTVRARYTTGVEMEALTGVTVALLSIWDMVKYLEKDENGQYPTARLEDIRVVRKEKVRVE